MAVYAGEGTTLKIGSTAIAQVVSIDPPEITVAEKDRTHLGSTRKEYYFGFPDLGAISFTLLFDKAVSEHSTLETSAMTPAVLNFVLTTTDADTRAFSGFVSSFKLTGIEENGDLMAEVTVRLTSAITVTLLP